MKKYTILAAMLLGMLGSVYAQDSESESESKSSSESYAPAAGDLSGAILFGRGNFLNAGLTVPNSASYFWRVPGNAPQNNTVSADDNSIGNIVGVEMRYFLQSNIALKLSGGAIHYNTPDRPNAPAVENPEGGTDFVPEYQAVVGDNRMDANVNLGAEYHFGSKYSRLFPYAGVTVPFYYARRSMYDPTITSNPDGTEPVIVDDGYRHAEVIGFGGQAVAGVDYYLMEGLYFGFEVKPVSYVYAYSAKYPAPGMNPLQADTHSFTFFSQTFMKVGFRF